MPERFCTNCGKAVDVGAKFCTSCGAQSGVGTSSAPPSKTASPLRKVISIFFYAFAFLGIVGSCSDSSISAGDSIGMALVFTVIFGGIGYAIWPKNRKGNPIAHIPPPIPAKNKFVPTADTLTFGDRRATWTRNDSDEWCILIKGSKLKPGTVVLVERRDGTTSGEIIAGIDSERDDGTLYKISEAGSSRLEAASKTNLHSLDNANQTAEFIGSTGEIYQTTLHSCTCQDFIKRGESCKHMYRLKAELNAFTVEN